MLVWFKKNKQTNRVTTEKIVVSEGCKEPLFDCSDVDLCNSMHCMRFLLFVPLIITKEHIPKWAPSVASIK